MFSGDEKQAYDCNGYNFASILVRQKVHWLIFLLLKSFMTLFYLIKHLTYIETIIIP